MSTPGKKPKLKQRASEYIPATRWMVEDDYRDKLSPADQEFLDRFNEAMAGDNPQLIYDDPEKQRELWRNTQNIRRDAMTGALHGIQIDEMSANPEDAINEMLDRDTEMQRSAAADAEAASRKQRVLARRAARDLKEQTEKPRPKTILRKRAAQE